jgi:AraC family transcriptional activator of pobA
MSESIIPLQKIAGRKRNPLKKFDIIRWGNLSNEYDFSKPHRHNYYEILIFFKGGGLHEIDFIQHTILNNSIHFVAANSVHLMRRDKRSDGATILFSEDFFYGDDTLYHFFKNLQVYSKPDSNVLMLSKKEFTYFEALYTQMEYEFESRSAHAEINLKSLMTLFLSRADLKARAKNPEEANPKSRNQVIERYREHIEKGFLSHKGVKEYAAELHISPKHLNDLCKQHFSMTAQNIIHQRLLLEIKRLLVHTDLTIKEVCFRSGFDDPAHFNHFFRFHLSMTPLDYRKSTR